MAVSSLKQNRGRSRKYRSNSESPYILSKRLRRLRSNQKKNSQYYRRRNFIRQLLNDPLKYYYYEKLRNYPHVYAHHFDIKLLPANSRNANTNRFDLSLPTSPIYRAGARASTGAIPFNIDGGGVSGDSTSLYQLPHTSTPKPIDSTISVGDQTTVGYPRRGGNKRKRREVTLNSKTPSPYVRLRNRRVRRY